MRMLNSRPSRTRKSSPGLRIPHFMAILRAVLTLSPVTIRTVMPDRWHLRIASGTYSHQAARGVVVTSLVSINEVNLRWVRFVLGWVTGFDSRRRHFQIKSNQIKFHKQQRAKSHLQVAKTLIKTINIFLIIRTEGKRSNRDGITQNKPYKI